MDRPRERRRSDEHRHAEEGEPSPGSEEGDRGDQDRRPDEIELLLDGQCPEVQERRRRLRLREVVAPESREVDVRAERRRPDAVRDHLAGADEVEEMARGQVGREQREGGRRQDPARTPHVEAGERDRAAPLRLGEKDSGDQEPGEDEEDVHADVAAAEERDVRVPEGDEQNRHRPEPLDVVSTIHLHLRGERRSGSLANRQEDIGDLRLPDQEIARGKRAAGIEPT